MRQSKHWRALKAAGCPFVGNRTTKALREARDEFLANPPKQTRIIPVVYKIVEALSDKDLNMSARVLGEYSGVPFDPVAVGDVVILQSEEKTSFGDALEVWRACIVEKVSPPLLWFTGGGCWEPSKSAQILWRVTYPCRQKAYDLAKAGAVFHRREALEAAL